MPTDLTGVLTRPNAMREHLGQFRLRVNPIDLAALATVTPFGVFPVQTLYEVNSPLTLDEVKSLKDQDP